MSKPLKEKADNFEKQAELLKVTQYNLQLLEGRYKELEEKNDALRAEAMGHMQLRGLAEGRVAELSTKCEKLEGALRSLLNDTQHSQHPADKCDEWCPVKEAREALGEKE